MLSHAAAGTLRPAARLVNRAASRRHALPIQGACGIAGPSMPRAQAMITRPLPATRYLSSSAPLRSGTPPARGEQPTQPLSQGEYERISEEDMDTLHEGLEIVCEQYGPEDWEVEYSSGVMTLSLPPTGTWVINKQPPNQQIWMSSPLSGPSRFGYSPDGRWTHHRKTDVSLAALLEGEIRGLLQKEGIDDSQWEGVGLEK